MNWRDILWGVALVLMCVIILVLIFGALESGFVPKWWMWMLN